ncbi:ipa protein [Fusarium langsethiae]|uniref:Ipa protein n=1 Tax=Fusarium langsethiae TaxID=179993 RepID=A0A0N0DAN2_FUSLA|nr:ipa protein [Fusarium langsethiae]
MEASSSEMIRELHGDLKRKWKAHGPKVETAWRSFNKSQRAKCMKAEAMEGQVLKHSRDASLGNVCKFIPEWNLEDITDPKSNLFLDMLKHRATKSLSEQYRSGHNGTAGDLDFIDEMARTRNLRHVDDFKNCFTFFDERQYGFSFCVTAGQNVNEVLSGMESAIRQRYIIPQSLGELVLQRQLYLLQALNIMIEDVLDQGSKTRDRSQLGKNSKPAITPLSNSVSKQVTVKLNSQELSAIASDQESSLQEYLSLLCEEPTVLCAGVNVEFFSRPELVPDEKGRSLPVHTDRYVGPAVFETIYHAVQGIAVWESIIGLLDPLEKPSTDKLYKSTVLQELSNMCHLEYARTQALFRRQVSTGIGSKWFKRLSNVYDRGGNAKVSMKGKPEELTRSDPQLHYLLRLCQPETTITQAVEWMQKLTDLYKAHPLEREKLCERESRTLYDMAAIIVFVQDLSAVYSLPSSSRKKGILLVAGLQEVDAALGQIKKEVDLRDFAAPIDNLLEPGVSQKALEALDRFVIERTGTKIGSLYQAKLEKAFQDIEEQYQKAKEKSNKDTKADFVPIDTTSIDTKDRIETQRQKEKTRPEHSSIYAITMTTDSAEENEVVKPPQPVKVSSSTAQVFAILFDKAQSRGSVSWTSFEAAMSELGFSVLPRFGSVYTFRPSEDMDIKRPINIHRPHQSRFEGYMILILAGRLSRAYGWSENSFIAE